MENQAASEFWPILIGIINLAAAITAAGHALLTKRDVRASVAWLGVIILLPVFGWAVYLLFGINRIARRAEELRSGTHATGTLDIDNQVDLPYRSDDPAIQDRLADTAALSANIAPIPFTLGNDFSVLINGDEAYPAMIEAIRSAEKSVALSSYLFNNDAAGAQFLDALKEARNRNVKVRVLIDGVGSWYSFPSSMVRQLRKAGIPYARFLHSLLPWSMPYLNLRNHQKILVVDGKTGFTGSMNIAVGNLSESARKHQILDTHFRMTGPVVSHLMAAFAHEWEFSTGEILTGSYWFPDLDAKGPIIARGLPAGPDMSRNTIHWTYLAALGQAKSHIRIATPYFLPDAELTTALSLAAMRGVRVDIVLPGKNNLFYMTWAATPVLRDLAANGCNVWLTQQGFDHSKLMTVDGLWSLVGSANWDPRSLRLNFELNVEAYDRQLAETLDAIIDGKTETAIRLDAEDLAALPLYVRLRNATVRLMSPYL